MALTTEEKAQVSKIISPWSDSQKKKFKDIVAAKETEQEKEIAVRSLITKFGSPTKSEIQPQTKLTTGEARNVMSNIIGSIQKPAGAIRGAIQNIGTVQGQQPFMPEKDKEGRQLRRPLEPGQFKEAVKEGAKMGFEDPERFPTFRTLADNANLKNLDLKDAQNLSTIGTAAGVFGQSLAGETMDIITDPILWTLGGANVAGKVTLKTLNKTMRALETANPGQTILKASELAQKVPGAQFMRNVLNVKNPVSFARTMRTRISNAKEAMWKPIETLVKKSTDANPNLSFNLQSWANGVKDFIADPKSDKAAVREIVEYMNQKGNSLFKTMVEFPDMASKASFETVQNVKTLINRMPGVAKARKFNGDHIGLDWVDDLRGIEVGQIPGLDSAFTTYSNYMNKFKRVGKFFKEETFLNKIRSNFGNEEMLELVKSVVPESVYADIGGFKGLDGFIRTAKKVAGPAIERLILVGGALKALRFITNQ